MWKTRVHAELSCQRTLLFLFLPLRTIKAKTVDATINVIMQETLLQLVARISVTPLLLMIKQRFMDENQQNRGQQTRHLKLTSNLHSKIGMPRSDSWVVNRTVPIFCDKKYQGIFSWIRDMGKEEKQGYKLDPRHILQHSDKSYIIPVHGVFSPRMIFLPPTER